MVSNPGGVGLLGSVVGCFELARRDVTAVPVEALVVEPVHPRERGEFELVDVVPWPGGVGSEDALGLVEPVRGLGERVVAVGDRADRGSSTDLVESLSEPHGRELLRLPASE